MVKKSEGTKTDKSMGKPKGKSVGQLDESPIKMDESVNKSVGNSVGVSISKYLQLHGSDIHKYSRAYLEAQFRGIIKTTEAWKEEINKVMEGDK